jgi:hypothetical protein
MRAAGLVVLGLLAFPAAPALAQEASVKETRCWVGDVAFSAGAGINAGDSTAVCQAGSGWKQAEAGAPVIGCLLEGELSSIGAVVGIRNNDTLLLQCGVTGRWVAIGSDGTGVTQPAADDDTSG